MPVVAIILVFQVLIEVLVPTQLIQLVIKMK